MFISLRYLVLQQNDTDNDDLLSPVLVPVEDAVEVFDG